MGADEFVVPVYYSVGTSTADLKTGSPGVTISITGGVATLSVAQTQDVGVGDVIDYDTDNKKAYIAAVQNSTELTVRTATGMVPADIGAKTVNSIKRAFNSITDAVSQSSNSSHLNTANLVTGNYHLTWVCYNDAAFVEAVNISGYSSDVTHYLTLTVAGSSDVTSGATQRHDGRDGTGAVIQHDDGSDPEGLSISVPYTRVEWLEMDGSTFTGTGGDGVEVEASNVHLEYLVVHDWATTFTDGIWVHDADDTVIRNSLVYDNEGSLLLSSSGQGATIQNVTIFNGGTYGVRANNTTDHTVQNVISMDNPAGTDCSTVNGGGFASFNNNLSSDGTGDDYGGTGNLVSKAAGDQFVSTVALDPLPDAAFDLPPMAADTSGIDLHLKVTADAVGAGGDLSSSFSSDIDGATRSSPWDMGADEYSPSSTAVSLVSLEAIPGDSLVELRVGDGERAQQRRIPPVPALDESGPWQRITDQLILGLGTTPLGQQYSYLDPGLANGTTYYYRLEDIELSGHTTSHGPVSATPLGAVAGPGTEPGPGPEPGPTPAPGSEGWTAHGDPTDVSLREVYRSASSVTFELRTGGFYSWTTEDGTSRIAIPGFMDLNEPGLPMLPTKRLWTPAVTGRGVRLASIQSSDEVSFDGMRLPRAGAPELVSLDSGAKRASFRAVEAVSLGRGSFPRASAQLLQTAFQGEVKKAYIQLAPLTLDAASGRLTLARTLLVQVAFDGLVEGETGSGSIGRRPAGPVQAPDPGPRGGPGPIRHPHPRRLRRLLRGRPRCLLAPHPRFHAPPLTPRRRGLLPPRAPAPRLRARVHPLLLRRGAGSDLRR